jgi:hypothetical protein
VPELEEYFDIDEYFDYISITKPTVVLPLGDLIKLHQVCAFSYYSADGTVSCMQNNLQGQCSRLLKMEQASWLNVSMYSIALIMCRTIHIS